ncbi:MAG: hypothetical protein JWN70_1067 [Planctomycetaceae bacterium]|nr:hypothetical protein [Planctomycetaceae bacterium]
MPKIQEDPVLISARREALVVFACWAIAMTWSVSYCYLNGYITDPSLISNKQKVEVRQPAQPGGIPELWVDHGKGSQRVEFVLGFPSWIFWGVALPWWICTAFSLFFGAFIVRDEDLGLDPEAAAALEAAHV